MNRSSSAPPPPLARSSSTRSSRATAPVLVQACREVGAVQVRNMGTLGGNVANAAACADSLPALVCLDAVATIATVDGECEWSVADLVRSPNHTRIPPNGILVSLRYTVPAEGSRSAFLKLGRRNAMAISRLTVAVLGRLDASGRIAEVRLVPGAATPQIRRFQSVESRLLGQTPSQELFEQAGHWAAEEMIGVTGRRWSTEFKEPALAAMVTRALDRVFLPDSVEKPHSAKISDLPVYPVTQSPCLPVTIEGRGQMEFTLNGRSVSIEAPADASLLAVLRDHLGLTGTKEGCAVGECGACSVLLDGRLVNSCLTLAAQAAGRNVITIEGIRAADGGPNDLQQSFIDHGAVQCGYCTPGMVLAGEALLAANPSPNRGEIRTAIAGNLCRCTGYQQIVDAVEATAAKRRGMSRVER